ncbi:MAG TPA: DUF4442 domain-containing protein [Puia sp.]|jgi:hypothetical protein|nr:DUF4442 domain-containing protein [Puia sp.]
MDEFVRLLRSPIRFRLYLLMRIPSAFFSGIRVAIADETSCAVTVPFKWFTRNPFRSTYFACLGMAAEMSTGVLAMAAIYKRNPPVSMLVINMEASFHKKAVSRTTFVCVDGPAIKDAIARASSTGEAQIVRIRSVGTNPAGEIIAEFYITWSFKVRERK